MYLSQLLIDVGDNPDRPRPGRTWLRNIYTVHQRLCMAFPSNSRVKEDPSFIEPFKPRDFDKQVHVSRETNAGFLFRIDPQPGGRVVILVQSAMRPNWDYAFLNADHLLAAPPEVREHNPAYSVDQELRFRIRVNLSKKGKRAKNGTELRKERQEVDSYGRQKDQGKRISLTWDKSQRPDDVIREWFARKTASAFDLKTCNLLQLGWVIGYKPIGIGKGHKIESRKLRLRSALLEGSLGVSDASAFAQMVSSGVGAAKAFGFGLLSTVPPM
ncbi:type I-E CRISPR-associated protein Cas6/Cse3/CasE [bacterium]|nr:type I-E CRISPR-associated protein Cas6/Cse3/CasE [bacterium]